jgi:integrase/recombinase XerC
VRGKGGKRRTVPVGAPALAALDAWLACRSGWLAGHPGADPHALFLSSRGPRLGARAVQRLIGRMAIERGVPSQVHPHVLRHSFASHLLQSSGDLRAVQELLGHASIATTQVYTSLDFQRLAAVYDAAHPRARSRR